MRIRSFISARLSSTLVSIAIATVGMVATPAFAVPPSPEGTYVDWNIPGTHESQDFYVYPTSQNQYYFWADQFSFTGGQGCGAPAGVSLCAYMGLQNNASGHVAIFSVFGNGVTGSTGQALTVCSSGCEGPGWSILVPYAWQVGHYYRVRAWIVGTDTWGFWVAEVNAALNTVISESYLGSITAPGSHWIGASSTTFTEDFGPSITACSQIPYAGSFQQVRDESLRATTPSPHFSTNAGCNNSSITKSGSWYEQQMGVPQ